MKIHLAILGFVLACDVVSTSHGGEVIVADNIPTGRQTSLAWDSVGLIAPSWNSSENNSKGQFFTPTNSGTLTTIQTILASGFYERVVDAPPLDVSIYTSNAGIPVEKLGTRRFSSTDFYPVNGWDNHLVTIDFSSLDIGLIGGEGYMVLYESPYGVIGKDDRDAPYQLGLLVNPPASLGSSYSIARNGADWEVAKISPPYTFQLDTTVRVNIVPEPTSGNLALLYIMSRLLRRSKHGTLWHLVKRNTQL